MNDYTPTKGDGQGVGLIFKREDFSVNALYCNLKCLKHGYKTTKKKVFKDLIDEYNQLLAEKEEG